MSFKAKDLHFDNSQPAFLQRLRGQLTSGDTARHEQPIARNKRLKKDDDEDDAPTYVMEETNQSLTKEEYEAFVSGKEGKDGKDEDGADESGQLNKEAQATATKPKEKIAEVGTKMKKRKAAKIIGDDQEGSWEAGEKDGDKSNTKAVNKAKKKAKAVKLTFGDGDEG